MDHSQGRSPSYPPRHHPRHLRTENLKWEGEREREREWERETETETETERETENLNLCGDGAEILSEVTRVGPGVAP